MRKLLAVLALLLAGGSMVWADGFTRVVDTTTNAVRTRTVFNDNGSAIVSGEIVVWEISSNNYRRNGYPYVVKTTTTDSPAVAGVVAGGLTCPDQQLCEIVVQGPAIVKSAQQTDAFVVNKLVSTSSVSGQAGDYTAAADTCFLGMALELRDVDSALAMTRDGIRQWVEVNPGCE